MFLRYNYPVDELYLGPMIRTWCMTFEAVLQILKLIASYSNYKGVCKRMARIWAIRQGLMLQDKKMHDIFAVDLSYSTPSITVAIHMETHMLGVLQDDQNKRSSAQYEMDSFGIQVAPHEPERISHMAQTRI